MERQLVARYLQRIGLDVHVGAPSLQLLAALQVAHLQHVPFENLDPYWRRPVPLDLGWSLDKIVAKRRGGWCLELNPAFADLLGTLGFDVDLLACQVWEGEAVGWGPEFDHACVMVRLDGARFLVDVGFGDNALQPLLLEDGERPGVPRPTRMRVRDDTFELVEFVELEDGRREWEPQLRGDLVPRRLDEFAGRNHALQYTPGSSWTTRPFATRALDAEGSRVTLRRDVLRTSAGVDGYETREVALGEWCALLEQHFGIRVGPPRPV